MTSTDHGPRPDGRRTRQRDAIRADLAATGQFRTAQQIHDRLRELGQSVSLPTVYRTLAAMVEAGEVDQLTTDGQAAYRRCSPQHHHHLVCRSCGRTIEVSNPPLESWATELGHRYGFDQIHHVTELTGICPDCRTT